MLRVASIFKGCSIQAKDGKIGCVGDVLFDDTSWKLRWLVVATGGPMSERRVLVHPSAIGETDGSLDKLYVELTRDQISNGPDIMADPPVSWQRDESLGGYDFWDGPWEDIGFTDGSMADPRGPSSVRRHAGEQDPHLRSANEVSGYHIHAVDGAIGHLQDCLIDDEVWEIRGLIVNTRNWLPGARVMLAPAAVVSIDWFGRRIELNLTREQVRGGAPAWQPDTTSAPA